MLKRYFRKKDTLRGFIYAIVPDNDTTPAGSIKLLRTHFLIPFIVELFIEVISGADQPEVGECLGKIP